jgi:diguanylate cyclase (GGDEF)-like protein
MGLGIFALQRFNRLEWIKRVLDVSIVLVTLCLVFWICLFKPILSQQTDPEARSLVFMLIYPLADLILFIAVLAVMYFRPKQLSSKSLWFLLLSIAIMSVSDYVFCTGLIENAAHSEDLANIGWWYSTISFTVAGISQSETIVRNSSSVFTDRKERSTSSNLSNWLLFFPYFLVMVAYVLFILYHNSPLDVTNELLIGVGLIIGLVIIRQILVLFENKQLVGSLTNVLGQLKIQTEDLDRSNQALQKEIEKRNLIQEKLSYDAMHDPLTGLSNRVLFTNRLQHAFEKNKRRPGLDFSVLFLDLDNFKSINDILGHIAGDMALIELGQRLGKCVRAVDTLARFGGDEFVILLENTTDLNVTLSVANRILYELERPFLHNDTKIVVTCSIGIVQSIQNYQNSEDVLRDVDIAMYTAKKTGKAKFEVFNIEMGTAATYQLEVEGELHRAITNKELFLQYQPVINLETNTISGFEALLRWQHPMRGLLEPDDFIPIAEDSGAMKPIGDWVVKSACDQMHEWHMLYPDSRELSISVNFSGKQILRSSMIESLKQILNETGLDPKKFRVEITENTLIMDQKVVNEKISKLRQMGVVLSVDDFGTGYSSLFNLHNFTIDEIKIDKAFAEGISEGRTNFEICKAIIQMAKQLGIATVVEGIETVEQLNVFQALHCDYGQGYFLAHPMTAAEIEQTYLKEVVYQLAIN